MKTLAEKEILDDLQKIIKKLNAYNKVTPDIYEVQDAEIEVRTIYRNLKEFWR